MQKLGYLKRKHINEVCNLTKLLSPARYSGVYLPLHILAKLKTRKPLKPLKSQKMYWHRLFQASTFK